MGGWLDGSMDKYMGRHMDGYTDGREIDRWTMNRIL